MCFLFRLICLNLLLFNFSIKMSTEGSSMRPFVVDDLVKMVMGRKNMTFDDAVSYLYSSDLYMKILDEDAKMWYLSTESLYVMLESEKRRARRSVIPDKILMFRVFCLEKYCDRLDMYHEAVFALFKQYDVFSFLDDTYEVLHTQDEEYIVESIHRYINQRRRRK